MCVYGVCVCVCTLYRNPVQVNEARDKEARLNSFLARVAQAKRNFPVHTSPQKWDARDQVCVCICVYI